MRLALATPNGLPLVDASGPTIGGDGQPRIDWTLHEYRDADGNDLREPAVRDALEPAIADAWHAAADAFRRHGLL